MRLCDWQIRNLCDEQRMIVPFTNAQLNPSSYDVRLGEEIMIESVESPKFVRTSIVGYTKQNPWPLHPGEFCLACTEEIFNIPNDISAEFALKSSRGREGYSHALSAYIDPGFHNSRLTLELHNIRSLHSVPLYPGLLIGQIIFSRMAGIPTVSYEASGNYNNSSSVRESIWQ